MKKIITIFTTVVSLSSAISFTQNATAIDSQSKQNENKSENINHCIEPHETLYSKAAGISNISADDLTPEKCADMVLKMTALNKDQFVSYYCQRKTENKY